MNNILEDEYLMYNTSSRVPICFCVDTSATAADSPAWQNALSQIEKGINSLYTKVREDDMICNCVEVAAVGYNDSSQKIQDYTCTSKYADKVSIPLSSTMTGSGDVGLGILQSLDLLQNRKQLYNAHGVDYYKPWLILIADGKPIRKEFKKNVALARKKTLGLEKTQKLTVVTIYININESNDVSNTALAEMKKQSKNKKVTFSKVVDPQILGVNKIPTFFDWLGNSVSKFAFENEFKLDFSGLTDWEDI